MTTAVRRRPWKRRIHPLQLRSSYPYPSSTPPPLRVPKTPTAVRQLYCRSSPVSFETAGPFLTRSAFSAASLFLSPGKSGCGGLIKSHRDGLGSSRDRRESPLFLQLQPQRSAIQQMMTTGLRAEMPTRSRCARGFTPIICHCSCTPQTGDPGPIIYPASFTSLGTSVLGS